MTSSSSSPNHAVRGHVARRRKDREPKLVENTKTAIVLKGHKASETISHVLRDLATLKHDTCVMMTRKNDMLPIEDATPLEHLCQTHDAGHFIFGNTNKKRPDNLILGRLFDGQVLDMIELGVSNYRSIEQVLKANSTSAAGFGRPVLVFRGEAFANAPAGAPLDALKSLLIDLFQGRVGDELDLETLDLTLVFSSDLEGKRVRMQGYRMAFGKPVRANGAPTADLLEHGPTMDLKLRRSRVASPALAKFARRTAKLPGSGKQKNVTTDIVEGKVGRIHMHKQDTNKLVMRSRFKKALKRGGSKSEGEGQASKKRTRQSDD